MKTITLLLFILLVGCMPGSLSAKVSSPLLPANTITSTPGISNQPSLNLTHPAQISPTPTPQIQTGKIPVFSHVFIILLENQDYKDVIGNSKMPFLNQLASGNVLLSNYYAVTHPSLPNYIALVSGGTQNITSDCKDCFVNQPNLADAIETSGRTWKTYQEDMPSPCFTGDQGDYVQKHNPFIYFDSIRLNPERCNQSVVPLTQLDSDLQTGQIPEFSLITPNMCNDGHDCSLSVVDGWLKNWVGKLQSSPALARNSLIVITFDEASAKSVESCCGMGPEAGGRIATILVSPEAKTHFDDPTAYSHYSLLKTIQSSWDLPYLGMAGKDSTPLIEAPWSAGDPSTANPSTTSSLEGEKNQL